MKKATWLHTFPDTPEKVRAVVRRLAEAEFDIFIPCVKQVSGEADYHSSTAKVRERFRDWDPLAVACEEAATVGIDVHAWCCVMAEGKESALLDAHPEYEAKPGDEFEAMEPHRFVCHHRPEAREYELSLYRELIDGYDIAAVHLDYIRTSWGLCFCDFCREDFRRETGGDLGELHLAKFNQPDAQDMDVWIDWRCAPVTDLVRRVREAARAGNVEVSAAVFSDYPGTLQNIGQDWVAWCREGLLDRVFPMNYTVSTRAAVAWARGHRTHLDGCDTELREGVLRPSAWTTERFVEHVRAIGETGVAGVTVFEYPYLTDEDLSALRDL